MTEQVSPKHILVADDEEDVAVLLCRILADAGYDVDSARDGVDAVQKIQARRPDLLVLDLMMPGLDGWGVLEQLRELANPPPVLVVTARSDFESLRRAIKAGATGYVFKPLRIRELVATCERILADPGPAAAKEAPERRREPRRKLMLWVRVLSKEQHPLTLGELVDLSPGGAQVELPVLLEIGDRVRLAFHAPGGGVDLSLQGEVKRRQSSGALHCHGLSFVDVGVEEGRHLQDLLGQA